MDINALSNQFLYSSHVPLSSGALNATGKNGGGDFAEILRRKQNTHAPMLPKESPIDKTDKLYELCAELETFLIKNLIKGMRSTVQKSNLIDTGFAGEIYEDMLFDEYAKTYSQNANFGFAEMAYRELAKYK